MKRTIIVIAIIAVVGAAVWYAFGGSGGKSNRFGQGADSQVIPISAIQQAPEQYLGKTVTVDGAITKECPSSGCWWYLKDATGEIRANSFGNGFALPLHKEGRPIRTTGKVVTTESGELELAATGAEFR